MINPKITLLFETKTVVVVTKEETNQNVTDVSREITIKEKQIIPTIHGSNKKKPKSGEDEILCFDCGRKGHKCFECQLKKHPDFNTEKGLSWSETKKGKEWKAKGKDVLPWSTLLNGKKWEDAPLPNSNISTKVIINNQLNNIICRQREIF